ncbi:MAG TPA: hypothetical protein VNI01_08370 [Elusimicrobiota bacterium]|jgi:hypothetical protein|nr:hypothetical protein [Elusimicrobiota bacterium]
MSSHSMRSRESLNFLALSLVREVIAGRKTVEQARDAYTKTAASRAERKPSPTKQ